MNYLKIITEIVTILGFFVLFWYACETRKLRKIANNQKDLQILPLPFIYFNGAPKSDNFLMIKNLGYGSALSTNIENFKFNGQELAFRIIYTSNFRDFGGDLLKPENTQDLRRVLITHIHGNSNKSADELFYEYFAADGESMENKGRELTITFRDIQNNAYEIKEHFDKAGPTITQLPKRIGVNKLKNIKSLLKKVCINEQL